MPDPLPPPAPTLIGAKEAFMQNQANDLAAVRKRELDLLSAARELVEQVESLEGYQFTRDLDEWEAEAVFDDALSRLKHAIRVSDLARSKGR